MKQLWKNTYYKHILLALLTVNLIPVLFLGGSIINLVTQQKKTVYQTVINGINNQTDEIETGFRYVENAMVRVALSSSMYATLRTDLEAANFQVFHSIRSELQLIDSSEANLEDIFIANRNNGWIAGAYTLSSLEKYGNESLLDELFGLEDGSSWYADQDYVYLVKKLPLYDTRGNAIMTAQFRKQIFSDNNLGGQSGYSFVVLDRENRVIYGGEEESRIVLDTLNYSDKEAELLHNQVASNTYHRKSYIMAARVSEYNGWKYIYVVPNSVMQKMMNRVFIMLAFVVLGMLVTGAYLIFISSRRLYKPINEITMLLLTDQEGDSDSLPENDLQGRIKGIMNQNTQIQKRLIEQESDRKELFLRRIYQGEEQPPDGEVFLSMGILTRPVSDSTFYIMAVKYKEHFKTEEDRQLYMFALNNVLEELIDGEDRTPPVTIGKIVYIMCCLDTDSKESADLRMQTMATMVIQAVQKYIKATINIGISSPFHQLNLIPGAVEESGKALRDAMRSSGTCNFFHDLKESRDSLNENEIRQGRIRVMQAIDMGDREKCRHELDNYLYLLQGTKYHVFKLELCKLVSEILACYSEYAMTPDYGKIGDIIDFDVTKRVSSIETLRSYLWDYALEQLFLHICDRAEQQDVIYLIAEYISENIEQDINLEDCAKHFNYNPNYLSRLFKKNFGKTYTDYVTEMKMERCKDLLTRTDISVNELSERFGYSSPQNFIRVFKKYTLMTPGQFRKKNSE